MMKRDWPVFKNSLLLAIDRALKSKQHQQRKLMVSKYLNSYLNPHKQQLHSLRNYNSNTMDY